MYRQSTHRKAFPHRRGTGADRFGLGCRDAEFQEAEAFRGQSPSEGTLWPRETSGLRVAEASIMPTITGGNTNAPVLMTAE